MASSGECPRARSVTSESPARSPASRVRSSAATPVFDMPGTIRRSSSAPTGRRGAQGRGRAGVEFGQLVVAGSTIADFGAVILLSLLFSQESSGIGNKLILPGMFVTVIAAAGLAGAGAGRARRVTLALVPLVGKPATL